MVVLVLATGSVTFRHSRPSESDVIHDHIRLRQHQIATITCIGVRIHSSSLIAAHVYKDQILSSTRHGVLSTAAKLLLIDHVRIRARGGTNGAAKVLALIAGIIAGADSICDMDL